MYRRGFGRCYYYSQMFTPRGYSYVGLCRCGKGPNAYYQDKFGRIVHFNDLMREDLTFKEGIDEDLEILKKEKEEIEKRIEEIEKLRKE